MATESTTPHYLVVTLDSSPEGEESDFEADVDYSIDCPGVTDACRMWLQCTTCADLTDEQRDELYETGKAHGQEHQHIWCGWAVKTDSCFVAASDHMPDAAQEAVSAAGITGPGRWAVDWDFDEEYVGLTIVDPEVVTS